MFKFRSLSEGSFAYTKQILEHGQIYFSKYEELNDPFEYSYIWTTNDSLANKVAFWKKQDLHYQTELAGKTSEEQERFITGIEKTMSAPRGIGMIGADQIGVFCASTDPENQVLWSLYADSHRGVCFGFDSDVDEVLKQKSAVTYTDTPGEFSLYKGVVYRDVLTRKFQDWRHEREVRVFYNPGPYSFASGALRTMTFGVSVGLDYRNWGRAKELMEICRTNFPDMKIQRFFKEDAKYKFRLEEI